jgi:polyphenol oxidase
MLRYDWPVPAGVRIAMTDRHGGVSSAPYDSLNLGCHVGDDIDKVLANRDLLARQLKLPAQPVWLEQVHGTRVLDLDGLLADCRDGTSFIADGSYSSQTGRVCVVMTADCLPVLLCNASGTEVSALHAGWRGLCDGIIEQGVSYFSSSPQQLIAYLGPAIGVQAFEVGPEVRQAFVDNHPQASCHFRPVHGSDRYMADLVGLASLRLRLLGIEQIYSADLCTYSNSDDFFSYRRDTVTGRQASLIWLE